MTPSPGCRVAWMALLGLLAACPQTSGGPWSSGGGLGGATSSTTSSVSSQSNNTASSSVSASTSESPEVTCGGTPGGEAGKYGWYTDSDLWQHPTALGHCVVCEANLPSAKIPRRTWASCGDGCLIAPANLPDQALLPGKEGAVATTVDGVIYYRVSGLVGSTSDTPYNINEVSRLPDDAAMTMLRLPKDCMGLSTFNSPWSFYVKRMGVWGVENDYRMFLGYNSLSQSSIQWAFPGLPWTETHPFTFDDGWGFIEGGTVVKVALTPGSSKLTTAFDANGAWAFSPIARGELIVWTDWSDYHPQHNRGRLRSWTASGGSKVLVPPSSAWDYGFAGLSDTRLVWLGASGDSTLDGAYESTRLFWSPISSDPEKIQVHEGPMVEKMRAGPTQIVTWGSRAAMLAQRRLSKSKVELSLFVVDFDTGQTWSIASRPGRWFLYPLAMNDKELLVQELVEYAYTITPDSLVRLDLTKLDDLAAGWPAP